MNPQNLHKDSGDVERYTQNFIINAVRDFYGGVIDLDPATCAEANKSIKARWILTKEDNALDVPWQPHSEKFIRAWLNHPFGQPEKPCKSNCIKKKCKKRGYCVYEYQTGNIDWAKKIIEQTYKKLDEIELCNITFASTSSDWWQLLRTYCSAVCYPKRRDCYKKKITDKSVPPKDSSIFYYGNRVSEFKYFFETKHNIGIVV